MKPVVASVNIQHSSSLSHQQYLALAVPLIISGISTPILGAVDTAVVGRMSNPSLMGGVAVGTLIFNTMYWLFGFLRVSTTGFTSQAQGADDEREMILTLVRPAVIAVLIGLCFILFQYPILHTALHFIGADREVNTFASIYFSIRIWGAPFTLLSYVMIGWLMGLGKVKLSLAVQIGMNVLNIILAITLVLGLDFGAAGVAYATLFSEISAVLFGMRLIFRTQKISLSNVDIGALIEVELLGNMLRVNRDLFLRTACLLAMTGIFTAQGAGMGEVTLAANAVLLQIHYIMAYLFGGLANASSIIVGRSVGRQDMQLYKRAFILSAQWGLLTAIILSASVWLFGKHVVSLFTTITEVKELAVSLLVWMVIFPFVGFWGLQLEGIFSGATEARFIRDSIALALLVFLLVVWMVVPIYQNTGVWVAFVIFSAGRSFFLTLFIPELTRRKFC